MWLFFFGFLDTGLKASPPIDIYGCWAGRLLRIAKLNDNIDSSQFNHDKVKTKMTRFLTTIWLNWLTPYAWVLTSPNIFYELLVFCCFGLACGRDEINFFQLIPQSVSFRALLCLHFQFRDSSFSFLRLLCFALRPFTSLMTSCGPRRIRPVSWVWFFVTFERSERFQFVWELTWDTNWV